MGESRKSTPKLRRGSRTPRLPCPKGTLEVELQPELQNAARAVQSRRDYPEGVQRGVGVVVADICRGIGKNHVIEQLERFCPELQIETFAEVKVLDQRQVKALFKGSARDVAGTVAE